MLTVLRGLKLSPIQTYLTATSCLKPVWNVKGTINLEFDYCRPNLDQTNDCSSIELDCTYGLICEKFRCVRICSIAEPNPLSKSISSLGGVKRKDMFIAGWENQYTMTQHSHLELIEFI